MLASLKTWYTNNLSAYDSIILQNSTWLLLETSNSNVENATLLSTYTDSPIGLINILEYVKSINEESWMEEKYQWTMTASEGKTNAVIRINGSKYLSSTISSESIAYRLVVHLKSSVLFEYVIGTSESPFIISE